MLTLRPITAENLEGVLALKVSPAQKSYVSTVAASLAQAWVYRDTAFPFAVYAGDEPVGFVMLGYYAPRQQYTLWKFLIDTAHQHRGYGRQALRLAIRWLQEVKGANEVYTGVLLGNENAKRLYLSEGFAPTGLVENNMEELRLRC